MSANGNDTHFEPFIQLAGLTHDAALLAWGGFFFQPGARGGTSSADDNDSSRWMVVDDQRLDELDAGRTDSIGARSKTYGEAEVEVADSDGEVVARATASDVNHAWVGGLRPDAEYTYRIRVAGEPWGEGERFDWVADSEGRMDLRRAGRRYDNRFRTHPDPADARSLTFAALGDFGIGIRTGSQAARRQHELALALERSVADHDARLVLTLGDNIYHGSEDTDATGDEDDDWYFTFYQPYRYLLNRIPFYPTVGNHDTDDTEKSDDREQLADNYYLSHRFEQSVEARRASVDPGLFYVFAYGADVEFLCIDTTRDAAGDTCYFEHAKQYRFLEQALPASPGVEAGRVPWRIPFSHHPTYCAGPHHGNMQAMIRWLAPLFERAGVKLVLAGHEHNFQLSQSEGIHYIVSGAGGKLREEAPNNFADAHTRAWAVQGHFLIVELQTEQASIHPLTATSDGQPRALNLRRPDGGSFPTPIVVSR